MGKVSIRFRKKPTKPKRRKVSFSCDVDDGDTLSGIMGSLDCDDPSQIVINREWNWDEYSYSAVHTRMQTDDEFRKEMDEFLSRKEKYDAWYRENEADILAEIERRRVGVLDRKERVMRKEQTRLERELAKLEKELN